MEKAETAQRPTVNQENKNIAIIAYVTLIGLIIAFVMNNDKKDPFVKYHIRQMLGLAVIGLGLGVIGMVPIVGWIINVIGVFGLIYMWIVGLMNAVNEREKPVPFLGEQFEEWFKNV